MLQERWTRLFDKRPPCRASPGGQSLVEIPERQAQGQERGVSARIAWASAWITQGPFCDGERAGLSCAPVRSAKKMALVLFEPFIIRR